MVQFLYAVLIMQASFFQFDSLLLFFTSMLNDIDIKLSVTKQIKT